MHDVHALIHHEDPAVAIQELKAEHARLKAETLKIEVNEHLTPEEDAELKQLKRVKLAIKDTITQLEAKLAPAN